MITFTKILNSCRIEAWSLAWIALITFIVRSRIASVVPTGASCFMSATLRSEALVKRLPSSTMLLNNWYRTVDGSLYGRNEILSLIAPPGTSTSRNSPGMIGVSSPLILNPLDFRPPGRFDKVPASTSCLSKEVADFANPPIKCTSPKP